MTSSKARLHDFLFIDESGDPGIRGTSYYSCAVIHITAENIKHIYSTISTYRFIADDYNELKSHRIPEQKLRRINRLLHKKRKYFKCSVVFLDKSIYKGPYLRSRGNYRPNPNLFRKYIYRQVLNLHFKKYTLNSRHVEIIIDRSNLNNSEIDSLKTYLDKYGNIPAPVSYLISVDSRYVDLVQLADLISGQYKPNQQGVLAALSGFSYSFINQKDISSENALGEKYP